MFIYIEKESCANEAEEGRLIMNDEKCKSCDFYTTCRYMKEAMDEVMFGND